MEGREDKNIIAINLPCHFKKEQVLQKHLESGFILPCFPPREGRAPSGAGERMQKNEPRTYSRSC